MAVELIIKTFGKNYLRLKRKNFCLRQKKHGINSFGKNRERAGDLNL